MTGRVVSGGGRRTVCDDCGRPVILATVDGRDGDALLHSDPKGRVWVPRREAMSMPAAPLPEERYSVHGCWTRIRLCGHPVGAHHWSAATGRPLSRRRITAEIRALNGNLSEVEDVADGYFPRDRCPRHRDNHRGRP